MCSGTPTGAALFQVQVALGFYTRSIPGARSHPHHHRLYFCLLFTQQAQYAETPNVRTYYTYEKTLDPTYLLTLVLAGLRWVPNEDHGTNYYRAQSCLKGHQPNHMGSVILNSNNKSPQNTDTKQCWTSPLPLPKKERHFTST